MRHARAAAVVLLIAALALALLDLAHGQQIHRNGFEARAPVWVKGSADAAFRELVHEITDATAHTGQHSEHLQITSEQGSYIYYYYPTSRAPVTDDLSVSFSPELQDKVGDVAKSELLAGKSLWTLQAAEDAPLGEGEIEAVLITPMGLLKTGAVVRVVEPPAPKAPKPRNQQPETSLDIRWVSREEWHEYIRHVSPWEVERYLALY